MARKTEALAWVHQSLEDLREAAINHQAKKNQP